MKAYTDKVNPNIDPDNGHLSVKVIAVQGKEMSITVFDFRQGFWLFEHPFSGVDINKPFKWFYPPKHEELLTKELKLSSEGIQMLTNPKGL